MKKITMLLTGVFLLMVSAGKAQPSLTGKVVYHSYSNYDNWDSQLFIIDLASGVKTNISSGWNIDHEMNAHFSPDGTKLAFMGDVAGDGVRKWDIFIWTIGQGAPINLTAGNGQRDEDPKFSPDGTKIVYKEAGDIKIMDLSGNVLRNVTNSSSFEESMPYFTADGNAIIYAQGATTTSDIYKINSDGSNKVALITTPGTSDYYPITRDNSSFYYSRWISATDHHDQIYLYNYANGSSTSLPFNTSNADYSDAGVINSQYMLLASTKSGGKGGYDIYIANVNSGQIWSLDSYNSGANTSAQDLGASYFAGSIPVPTQTPYLGTPVSIPGKVEAENYDNGGQNIAYFDNTAGNSGGVYRTDHVDIESCFDEGNGYNIGYTASGEWMEYSLNITQSGTYNFNLRVATAAAGSQVKILMDGTDITGNVSIPNTGGWQIWQTVSVNNVNLTSGQKIMQVYTVSGGFNLNYVNVTAVVGNLNLALNKAVTASSTFGSGLEASNAVDGNAGTRWSSVYADPQWISVDLGATYTISRVKLFWEYSCGKNFKIQVSDNATTWSTIKTVTGNTTLTNDFTGLSGSGRYVRIYGTVRATQWGYSLWEFEVYSTSTKSAAIVTSVEEELISSISVFPNPVADVLKVNLGENDGQAEINVYSLVGKLLYSVVSSDPYVTIDMANFKTSKMVIVSISKNGENKRFKVTLH